MQWGVDWGFRMSVSKSQVVCFTRKEVPETVPEKSTGEYGWMPNSHGNITLIITKQSVKR